MLSWSPSTSTGTWRPPRVSRSISSRAWASAFTSRYITTKPSLLLASRALKVKGQVCLPKMVISLAICRLLSSNL
jgi:hypothetical protein